VEFDAERDLWTCDVELDLCEAYTPFVRLALARYQPSSIAGGRVLRRQRSAQRHLLGLPSRVNLGRDNGHAVQGESLFDSGESVFLNPATAWRPGRRPGR
jgi:hypothetical protein